MLKTRITAVSLCLVLLAVFFQAFPATAADPHENPETAPLVYDSTSVFQKYGQALNFIFAGNASGIEILEIQAAAANLPPELKNTAGTFFSSGRLLTLLLPELQIAAGEAKTMAAQSRFDDVRRVSESVKEDLTRAYADLLRLDVAAADTAHWWQILKQGQSPAYDAVQTKLLDLRKLLDSIDAVLRTLKQTPPPAARSPALTLDVQPAAAFVGETVTLRGVLTMEGSPLPGRIITLVADNVTVASVLSGNNGSFQKDIQIPYRYLPEMKLQAVFSPLGNDVGQYLGAASSIFTLKVLYYRASLSVGQGTPANPGRDFLVTAVFNYGNNTPLDPRPLTVFLDGDAIFDGPVGSSTFLRLPVAANVSVGTHNLSFKAASSGRYAPVAYSMALPVTRIVPVVEIDAPGLLLLPFSHDVKGKVTSSLGPLKNTPVNVALGGWRAAAVTGDDGSFTARLDTGLSFTLLGSQDLRVEASPPEPWYRNGAASVRVFVINPVNIAVILLVLTVPFFLLIFRKPKTVPVSPRTTPPVPVAEVAVVPDTAPEDDSGKVLLSLYRGVLRLVQALTSGVLQPFQTLREFARAAAPGLGALGGYFIEFTGVVERLLYSRHGGTHEDFTRAEELSRRILKGDGDENP